MKVTVVLIFSLSICYCASANEKELEIRIDKGIIRGTYRKSLKGRPILAFTGIPYAGPPIGKLRFQPPVEPKPWTGILDATKPHTPCTQIDIFVNDYRLQGKEDCLYLNVYKPKTQSKLLLPVLFYIHGGGFTSGHANPDLYGPDVLLDKDVILVTTNYRLGILGFLSTEDEVVPGNNGLKDQNFALKWAKKNIIHFGGDPDRITIFGQSAGGASVHFQYLSHLSKGLFNAAIAHSGSSNSLWTIAPKGQAIRNTKRLGKLLNCTSGSNQELVDCLRKVEAYDIVEQDNAFMEYSYDPVVPFKPVIEPDHEGAFITKHPIDLMSSGEYLNVPLFFGITTDDGAFKSALLYNDSRLIDRLSKEFDSIIPMALLYNETATEADTKSITAKIKEFYFDNKKVDDTTKSQITDLMTDWWFFYPQNIAARLHVRYTLAPVYYFVFGYEGSFTLLPFFGDTSFDYGVCHGDDLNYILSSSLYDKQKPNEADQKVIDLMTTIWFNIASIGRPTPKLDNTVQTEWLTIKNPEKLRYYFIRNENEVEMVENMYFERAKFWEELPLYSRQKDFKTEL